MNPERKELITNKLKEKFNSGILETYTSSDGILTFIVSKDIMMDLFKLLYDDADCKYDYLTDIASVHYPDKEQCFHLVYHLYSFTHNNRLRIKVPLKENESAPSVTSIWKTAEWHEREAFDLMGIKFDNHPDLRRILLPDAFEGHPLRKDYKVNTQIDTEKVVGVKRRDSVIGNQ